MTVNVKNLKRLCWTRGISVTDLASRLNRTRTILYRAIHHPQEYPSIIKEIIHELENTTIKCSHPACPNR